MGQVVNTLSASVF